MKDMASSRIQGAEPIENQVLVALRQINRFIDIHSRSLVKHYGLTGPQLVVLKAISKHREIIPGQLAKVVSLSQATITGILERLGRRGLVTRRRSESDRRRVLVNTTPEAEHMLDTGPPIMQISFVESFNRLHDWERTMILSSLQRLVSLMDADDLDGSSMLASGSLNPPLDVPISGLSTEPATET